MTHNFFISLHNFLDVNFDEVVEGINVLLDKPFSLEKGWNKLPLVL